MVQEREEIKEIRRETMLKSTMKFHPDKPGDSRIDLSETKHNGDKITVRRS